MMEPKPRSPSVEVAVFATTSEFMWWWTTHCAPCDMKLRCEYYQPLMVTWMKLGKLLRAQIEATGAGSEETRMADECWHHKADYRKRYPLPSVNCHLCPKRDPHRCLVACWYAAHPEEVTPPALFTGEPAKRYDQLLDSENEPAAPRTNDLSPAGASTEPPTESESR